MPASRFATPRKYPCASTLHSNSFSFTHFRKNASATPLVSHTFKTKDLKPFRFTHFQKNGRGRVPLSNIQPQTSHLRSSLNPLTSTLTKNASASALDSALTSKRASNSFTSNTYEKHTQGEGGLVAQASACVPTRLPVATTTATSHESRLKASLRALCASAIIVCSAKAIL